MHLWKTIIGKCMKNLRTTYLDRAITSRKCTVYVFFLFRHITNPSGAIHQNGLPDMSNHQQALRDSIFGGTGTDLSRLQWPRNSIPRRVKKLSWEDESYDLGYDRDISTFTDPDVSVTPLELQLEPSQVGRAIYF